MKAKNRFFPHDINKWKGEILLSWSFVYGYGCIVYDLGKQDATKYAHSTILEMKEMIRFVYLKC